MGFSFESAPEWPHFQCLTENGSVGWAWHEDPRKRRCFSAAAALPASPELVAAAIDGRDLPGVDKILAVARLRENVPSEHTMRLIFRFRCAACSEGNHRERVRQILLAAPLIHEGAIDALRAALVPERRLRNPLLYRRGESPLPEDPEGLRKLFEDADAKKKRRVRFLFARRLNLPVFPDDSARTRLAQIAWAEQYALKAGLE